MTTQHILLGLLVLGLAGGAIFFLLAEDSLGDQDATLSAALGDLPAENAWNQGFNGEPSQIETEAYREELDTADDLPALAEDGLTFALIRGRDGKPVAGAEVELVSFGFRRRALRRPVP